MPNCHPKLATGPDRQVFDLDGLSCASCVSKVERAIRRVPGVTDVAISLPLREARVAAIGHVSADVVAAVARLGYAASPRPRASNSRFKVA